MRMTDEQWKVFKAWMDRMEQMKKEEMKEVLRWMGDMDTMIRDMWMRSD